MWKIEWDDAASKELRKLDYTAQDQILSYLENRIATEDVMLGLYVPMLVTPLELMREENDVER